MSSPSDAPGGSPQARSAFDRTEALAAEESGNDSLSAHNTPLLLRRSAEETRSRQAQRQREDEAELLHKLGPRPPLHKRILSRGLSLLWVVAAVALLFYTDILQVFHHSKYNLCVLIAAFDTLPHTTRLPPLAPMALGCGLGKSLGVGLLARRLSKLED